MTTVANGHLGRRVAFWALLPLVAPQGLWVRRRAPRFADAAGPRSGSVGTGEPLRLLAFGDSIVAGVGAPTLDDALVGQFAAALATRVARRVEWVAVGKTGARSADLHASLLPRLPPEPFDVIAVSVGVNDVTGLVRSRDWMHRVGAVIDGLCAHSPGAVVLMAGLPPLWGFPLLPQPLRYAFGLRARTFDRQLEQVVADRRGCVYVPTLFEPDPEKFSADGYHPSPASYRVWGVQLADLAARERHFDRRPR